MFEEGIIRQIVSVENNARNAALHAWRNSAPDRKVTFLCSSGPVGMIGLTAVRLFMNWRSPELISVGFLGIDDYAKGEVRKTLQSTRELPLKLHFLTTEERIETFIEEAHDSFLVIAAAAEDGGFRAEIAETEAAASSNADKYFVKFRAGIAIEPPDINAPVPYPDVPALSRENVRNLDQIAMDKYAITGLSLMENAGWNLARETFLEIRAGRLPEPLLILAGRGNNGGDGLVAARHLSSWGVDCRVVMIGTDKPSTNDALANFQLASDTGVKIIPTAENDISVCVDLLEKAGSAMDAVLGTGLTGKLRGPSATALTVLANSGLPIIAADTPSGLDANTGEQLGTVPKALVTVTFAAPKLGFAKAANITGEVRVADIGVPWIIARQLAGTE